MVRGRLSGLLAAATAALVVAVSCTPPPSGSDGGGGGGSGVVTFDAGETSAAVRSEPLFPSFAIRPAGTARGRLAVLFNGTGAGPLALSKLGNTLAADGFHVIGLRYESAVGTVAACPGSVRFSDPDCHRRFRGEVVHGAGVVDPDGDSHDHAAVNVSAGNSVVHRLEAHLEYLVGRFPDAGWEQFQVRSGGSCVVDPTYGACRVHWDRVVALGHSQGAGVALYLAKHHGLDRVGMLSGAYDAFAAGGGTFVPAPWVAEGGFEVPASRIATFSHVNDPEIGFHRAVANAVGIPGPEVQVTTSSRPYGNRGRLVTNAPPACLVDSAPSHNSTATDLCAPVAVNRPVWRYLATGT